MIYDCFVSNGDLLTHSRNGDWSILIRQISSTRTWFFAKFTSRKMWIIWQKYDSVSSLFTYCKIINLWQIVLAMDYFSVSWYTWIVSGKHLRSDRRVLHLTSTACSSEHDTMNYHTFGGTTKENMQEITQLVWSTFKFVLNSWFLRLDRLLINDSGIFIINIDIQIYTRYSNIVLSDSNIPHEISKPIISYQDFISGL